MERAHQINAYACFAIGTSLNATLVWLVVSKSDDELRAYSRILLQTVLLNLLYLTIFAAYIPVTAPIVTLIQIKDSHI
jgi:hypothetical protein